MRTHVARPDHRARRRHTTTIPTITAQPIHSSYGHSGPCFARTPSQRPGFTGSAEDNARIGELAQLLRTLSGRYDQAARAASTS